VVLPSVTTVVVIVAPLVSKPGCTVAVYWDSENKPWVAEKTGGDMSGVGKRLEGICPGWQNYATGGDMSGVGKRREGIWPGWQKR